MDLVLLLARLMLAGVFIVAGVAKLADRRGSVQAMRDFGVPGAYAPLFGTFLPLAEIAVAITLIPTASARFGALGALVLLLAFVAGIGYNLARGNQPDCHCFGQIHSEPAGWPTLARNGVLSVVAAFVVVQGWDDAGASAVAWIGDLSAMESAMLIGGLIALAFLAIEGWVLVHLMRQNGRLLVRLDALEAAVERGQPLAPMHDSVAQPAAGLPIGAKAPPFDLPDVHGKRMTLEMLTSFNNPLLLLFAGPDCGPCNALMPEIGEWQRAHEKTLTIALVTHGDADANRAKSDEHGIRHVLLQDSREVHKAYQSFATPSAVLVRPDGTIGSALAVGSEAVRNLVHQTASAPGQSALAVPAVPAPNGQVNGSANGQSPVRIGQPVPPLRLSTLDGDDVSLTSIEGERIALLFWNPDCGFCARILADLKAAEVNPAEGAPRIILISTGEPERNRSMGLQSTILLDEGFAAGRAFGANGTPSGVLIDAEGRVASSVAAGTPAVLSLLTAPVPARV